ncbi:Disease resistance protein (NBS class) family [Raphanus sativus]|nr:Disease resistance protein (NBS class) family [Raphanus sativus]KAJ4915631.1 Disease resistance protein (NBS class) family [Raphanus sativus]
MGGCFSVSLSCDQVVNQFTQWLCLKSSYIHSLTENLASLQKSMEELKAKRDDVQARVDREEFTRNRPRLSQIQVWLTSVLTMENQYDDLLNSSQLELERLCLCGVCSKNVKMSYRYGKKVILMLREAERLSSRGGFDVVTGVVPVAEAEELPTQPTLVGRETMLEEVWNRLMGKVGIVGLHGMGGVGKTTLLTQINKKLSKTNGFDVVIWVVVSRISDIR